MKSRINKDEREVSISELWWYVISKWKWLVVGMLVGVLLVSAVGAYKELKTYKGNNSESAKELTMADLSEEEQREVRKFIEDNEFYLAEQERVNNDYLMKLDYNCVKSCSVLYYVDTDYSYNYLDVQENYTATLIALYKTYLQSEEVINTIMDLDIKGLEVSDIPYINCKIHFLEPLPAK